MLDHSTFCIAHLPFSIHCSPKKSKNAKNSKGSAYENYSHSRRLREPSISTAGLHSSSRSHNNSDQVNSPLHRYHDGNSFEPDFVHPNIRIHLGDNMTGRERPEMLSHAIIESHTSKLSPPANW
eukprot:Awhi_evm1s14514